MAAPAAGRPARPLVRCSRRPSSAAHRRLLTDYNPGIPALQAPRARFCAWWPVYSRRGTSARAQRVAPAPRGGGRETRRDPGAEGEGRGPGIQRPAVLRLRTFVKIPHRSHAPLTRRAVFARDEWACQYCGASAENLDHVVPRSRGGAHSWDNVVAACRRCNSRKENRLIEEVGLRLARRPVPPRDGFRLSIGRLEPEWEPYL
jgi:HNH endonuclease